MQSQFWQTDRVLPEGPFRVLVADPDADTIALYRQSFALAGCDVVEAGDGRDALTKALVRTPALVVTELRLPIIDGIALCEILRRDRSTATVPILVVTGEARSAELRRIQNAGADAVLVKPTTLDAVLAQARELLLHCRDARARAATARATADDQLRRSAAALARAQALQRKMFVKAHHRGITTTPTLTPPMMRCPSCDGALTYQFSHVGGVSARHSEQWDYYACSTCGAFQYRQRTRKLRRVDPDDEQWVNTRKQSLN